MELSLLLAYGTLFQIVPNCIGRCSMYAVSEYITTASLNSLKQLYRLCRNYCSYFFIELNLSPKNKKNRWTVFVRFNISIMKVRKISWIISFEKLSNILDNFLRNHSQWVIFPIQNYLMRDLTRDLLWTETESFKINLIFSLSN